MLKKIPSWEASLDEIHINALSIECVVGIYPREKKVTQTLELDLTLFLDTREAVKTNCLTKSVDYAALCYELEFLLQSAKYHLLETAAEAICHYILSPAPSDKPRGQVVGVEVTLRKPEALKGRAMPSLKVRRHRSEVCGCFEDWEFGEVYVIHSSSNCVLYRVVIPALKSSSYFEHTTPALVSEMPLTSGLVMAGTKLDAGVGLRFPQGFVRRYHNPTGDDRSLLCVAPKGVVFSCEERGDVQLSYTEIPSSFQTPYYRSPESGTRFY